MFAETLLTLVLCSVVATAASPTVKLDNGVFIGTTDGISTKFLGIPFAQPP